MKKNRLNKILNKCLVLTAAGIVVSGSFYSYHAVSLGPGSSADVPVTITYEGKDDGDNKDNQGNKNDNKNNNKNNSGSSNPGDSNGDSAVGDKKKVVANIQSGDENNVILPICVGSASISLFAAMITKKEKQ